MYSFHPTIVLGFHGCDRVIGEKVLSGEIRLKNSSNDYDWLGHGIYFWENNPRRALEYARTIKNNPERSTSRIKEEFVIGAIIHLGYCLNLLESKSLSIVKQGYSALVEASQMRNLPLPENKSIKEEGDVLLRRLDCAVIQTVHTLRKEGGEHPFDSVRGVFIEGAELYKNAGFYEKNHIQLCVRNPNCIKGYFRVLDPIRGYHMPLNVM